MAWSDADDLLTESRVYWIASVRPDGRPHIVPSDGVWLDDALYFGGSPVTVHMRNVRATGRAVAHVGDGLAAAVIVEGNVTDETPTPDVAARLAVANNTKYGDYGMTMQPEDYVSTAVTALRARRRSPRGPATRRTRRDSSSVDDQRPLRPRTWRSSDGRDDARDPRRRPAPIVLGRNRHREAQPAASLSLWKEPRTGGPPRGS